MKMKRTIGALMILLAAAACGSPIVAAKRLPMSNSDIKKVKSVTAYRLKDPASAQFRNIRRIEQTRQDGSVTELICGEVNGKNSFGGYTGFTTFHVVRNNRQFVLRGVGDADTDFIYRAQCGA
jgi:hypothetical protein